MMFQEQIDLLQQKGLYRSLKSVGYIDRQYIEVENKRCTNYTSNDYLGLGQIAFDKDDFERFMRKYSYHLSSSRLISGSSTAYEEIETMLAGWLGYSACTILNSGYDANLALFNIFKNTNCVVFSDQENHASIIDGIKLSGLEKVIYKHLDICDLEKRLAEYPNQNIPKIIISDSVFSTNGDVVDIGQLVSLKHKYNATLILDVSHSFGIENYSNYQGVDILTSSLSKACGAYGGVILSSNDVKDMLINHGRPLIYSSSLPIYNLYFIKRNIEKLINADDRRTKLNSLSKYFNQKLKALNVNYNSSNSPIKFIEFDDIEAAENIHQTLLKHHVFTSYLRYPTVTKPMLRISLSYFHTEQDVDRLFEILHQED
ncbi:TPA: pyridoxal phosphate-dependent aminotransferase family protein [Staphylococcus aureus]|nr:pyridoxal phosphate-dependent aminotransferase family protein [Staphylococcus aureus]